MTTMTKPRVTLVDLLWVAWRRHRSLILATTGLVALAALLMVWTGLALPSRMDHLSLPSFLLMDQLYSADMFFGAVVGVFWGAPLVSREYEQRTNLVVWSQDVSGSRWLVGQVSLLGAVAACLAAVVGPATGFLLDSVRGTTGGSYRLFQSDSFEAVPHVQIGYTLFAFALGVAAGTVTRRTLPAMAITAVGFLGVRVVLAWWGREHYLPPVHTFEAWSPPGVDYVPQVPPDALYVASGYADVNGVPIGDHDWNCAGRNAVEQLDCLKANGVAGHYAEFQPVERLDLFRWIETGIFLVLAAGLLVLAWWWLKQARRV